MHSVGPMWASAPCVGVLAKIRRFYRKMRLELTRRLPRPQTCLSTYSALSHTISDCSVITHSFCICQVFISFLAGCSITFYLRFVPISGIIPAVCILRKAGEAVAKVFCFAERCARKLLTLDGENAAHAKFSGSGAVTAFSSATAAGLTTAAPFRHLPPAGMSGRKQHGSLRRRAAACSVYMAYAKAESWSM